MQPSGNQPQSLGQRRHPHPSSQTWISYWQHSGTGDTPHVGAAAAVQQAQRVRPGEYPHEHGMITGDREVRHPTPIDPNSADYSAYTNHPGDRQFSISEPFFSPAGWPHPPPATTPNPLSVASYPPQSSNWGFPQHPVPSQDANLEVHHNMQSHLNQTHWQHYPGPNSTSSLPPLGHGRPQNMNFNPLHPIAKGRRPMVGQINSRAPANHAPPSSGSANMSNTLPAYEGEPTAGVEGALPQDIHTEDVEIETEVETDQMEEDEEDPPEPPAQQIQANRREKARGHEKTYRDKKQESVVKVIAMQNLEQSVFPSAHKYDWYAPKSLSEKIDAIASSKSIGLKEKTGKLFREEITNAKLQDQDQELMLKINDLFSASFDIRECVPSKPPPKKGRKSLIESQAIQNKQSDLQSGSFKGIMNKLTAFSKSEYFPKVDDDIEDITTLTRRLCKLLRDHQRAREELSELITSPQPV